MSGKVKGPEYDAECRSLLHQYTLSSQAIPNFEGLDAFLRGYNLGHCQSAKRRLEEGRSGYKGEDFDRNLGQRVFEITHKFISAIDVVSLNLTSVDQLAPAVKDIQQALATYPALPSKYTGTASIGKWVTFFSAKKASDELTEEEVRQLKYDLDNALSEFNEVVLGNR